jgi:hypothetical protein
MLEEATTNRGHEWESSVASLRAEAGGRMPGKYKKRRLKRDNIACSCPPPPFSQQGGVPKGGPREVFGDYRRFNAESDRDGLVFSKLHLQAGL